MRIDSEIVLDILQLEPQGEGLGRLDSMVVFVPYTLPGDKVKVRIREIKKNFARASLLEILVPGPGRVAPLCSYFGSCGGCSWQHMDYEMQCTAKASLLKETLKHLGGITQQIRSFHTSNPMSYRSRMRFCFSRAGKPALRQAYSQSLIEIATCPIADPAINDWLVAQAQKNAGNTKAAPASAHMHPRKNRHIHAASSTMPREINVFGIGKQLWLEGEREAVELILDGCAMRFNVNDFFQSNVELALQLRRCALERLSGDMALDLYAGCGFFASAATQQFRAIKCVESHQRACGSIRTNVPSRSLEIWAMRVEDWLTSDPASIAFASAPLPDLVLLDPPRQGLSPKLLRALVLTKPPVIAYSSCNMSSMARDLRTLTENGYTLDFIDAFDFYPHTSHLEIHARLRM